jgi:hypothetical protein
MEHHLYYPYTVEEMPLTEPAPKPFYGKYPEAFITEGYSLTKVAEMLINCKGPYGQTNEFTQKVNEDTWTSPQLGSALQFSARLIVDYMERLPNFNLDADRGYGWKTWRGTISEFGDVMDAMYIY